MFFQPLVKCPASLSDVSSTFCIAWLLHFRWLFTFTYTKVGERVCPLKWNIVDGQMAVIAAVFMPTDRVSKLNHGKGTKVLLAATSDRLPRI